MFRKITLILRMKILNKKKVTQGIERIKRIIIEIRYEKFLGLQVGIWGLLPTPTTSWSRPNYFLLTKNHKTMSFCVVLTAL